MCDGLHRWTVKHKVAVILTTKGSLTARNFEAAVKGNRAVKEVTVKDDGDFEELWM